MNGKIDRGDGSKGAKLHGYTPKCDTVPLRSITTNEMSGVPAHLQGNHPSPVALS